MSAARLHRLQQSELELAGAEQALARVRQALGGGEELEEARRQEDGLEKTLHELRSRQQVQDLELRSLMEKISGEEERLYSGRVRNPKELQDLDRELKFLQRTRERLEDELLQLMMQVEDRAERLRDIRERRLAAEEAWRRESGELTRQLEELEKRREKLSRSTRSLREQAPAGDLEAYEHLRRTKGGQAVAVLQGSLCQGCGVTNPAARVQEARRGTGLVTCSSCGRILYAP